MNKALLDKTSVHRAMFRNGMGWVDFVWGREGAAADSKGKRKGAMGLAHIMEARQRKDGLTQAQTEKMLFDLVETIAKGEEVQRFESGLSTTVKVDYGRYQVMLARKKGSNTWVVTGFEKDESDRGGSGYDAPPLTRSESTLTRNEAGADSQNIAQDDNNRYSLRSNFTDLSRPFDGITEADVEMMERLNHRPRKKLNYKTPFEVFFENSQRKAA